MSPPLTRRRAWAWEEPDAGRRQPYVVAEETSVVREETDAGRRRTSVVREETDAGRRWTSVVREETDAGRRWTSVVHGETSVVREETSVVHEETDAGRRRTSVVHEETSVVREETDAGRRRPYVVHEETSVVREETDAGRRRTSVVFEETSVVHEETDAGRRRPYVVHEETSVVREETDAGRRRTSVVFKETSVGWLRTDAPVLPAPLLLYKRAGERRQARPMPARPSILSRGLVPGVVLLWALPSRAEAPPPDPARLDYERPAAFASCPDESYFRHFVAARFEGLDPFTDTAPRRIALKLRRDPKLGFVAELAMYDGTGKQLDSSKLDEPTCPRVVESAARRVVSWILPIVLPEPAPPPAPAPPPVVAPPAPPPPVPAEPPVSPAPSAELSVPARLVPRIGVGGRAEFGAAWGAVFGVTVEGGVQRQQWKWGGWSVMGTVRWAPLQIGIGLPTPTAAVDVGTSLVAGSLAGCVHSAWAVSFAGCVVSELGEIQQSAGAASRPYLHQTALFGGAGVGVRVEAPLSGHLYLQVATDVLGIARFAGNTSAWIYVPGRGFGGASGGIGAGLGASF